MKYSTEQEAISIAKKLNKDHASKWFCPFRNDFCFGVGCVAFDAVRVKEGFSKFKLTLKEPNCKLSALEEMPSDSSFGAVAAVVIASAVAGSSSYSGE